jgi:homocitrate synthase NifV
MQLFQVAQEASVERVRIADTLGVMTPRTVSKMIEKIKTDFPRMTLEFHGHNDLGFATANALAALESGADAVSATVLGLGERCGNASLEQIAFALYQQAHPAVNHYRMERIMSMCDLVSSAARREIPSGQPLVGRDAVRHQSGIHVAGILKDVRSFQPFDPHIVGRFGPQLEFGPLSGKALLQSKVKGSDQLQMLWQQMRKEFQEKNLNYSA